MQTYKIEKGIKIPKASQGRSDGKPSKVALTMQTMKKGDSFLITTELEAMKASKVVRDRNAREGSGGGSKHFTSRRVEKGWRVWRLK